LSKVDVPAPDTKRVEEECNSPSRFKRLVKVDDAPREIKPPPSVERFVTVSVSESVVAPPTVRELRRFVMPVTSSVVDARRAPVMCKEEVKVEEAETIEPKLFVVVGLMKELLFTVAVSHTVDPRVASVSSDPQIKLPFVSVSTVPQETREEMRAPPDTLMPPEMVLVAVVVERERAPADIPFPVNELVARVMRSLSSKSVPSSPLV
jgi:hypothetical protein